jgi:hypothetical protein
MIYLSGSIKLLSQAERQRQADVYARNGWELKEPSTHRVSITLDETDIDAFCQYLRGRPRDHKMWTDRNGQQHQSQTVTFFLNGCEMTGNWTRLRAGLDPNTRDTPSKAQVSSSRKERTPAPVIRSSKQQGQANDLPQHPATSASPAANAAPVWNGQSSWDQDDEEIPF